MKNNYLFLLLISALSFGQIAQVKNINSTTTTADSSPTNFFDFNGVLYFRATNGTNGVELWKSDGTEAGTVMVKDINTTTSAASNSNAANFTPFNNQLYFTASNGTTANGTELWKTDGTDAGTQMVLDLNPGTAASNPSFLTVINSTTMVFSANNGTTGTEFWKTDGTTITNLIDQPGTGNSISWIENLNGSAIYSQLVVSTTGRELYKSDGTSISTGNILDINPGTGHGVGTTYFKNGNIIYFQGNSGTTGFELWKTDGTSAGTSLVKDINAGTTGSAPIRFASVGNITFFRANGANGVELWQTDGTEAGTTEVADINQGTGSSTPDQIQSVNGVVYFFASDDGTNYDFYKYENNLLTKLKDFNAPTSSATVDYIELNGIVYFTADSNADASRELWQTDGTQAGTVSVSPVVSGVSSLTKIGNKLFFAATGNEGQELFTYSQPALSVKDQDKLEAVAVYPNPSDGNLFINNADNETVQYEVFDVLGKKQAVGKTNGNSLHLNLKTGLYILKLTKNSQISTAKIIIK